MTLTRAPKVVFDWDGSLALARTLWSLGDRLQLLTTERRAVAGETLTGWLGAFAEQFAAALDAEAGDAARLVEAIREEANGWAIEWTTAMDQENFNRYQAACDRARDKGGLVDKIWDGIKGEDDLPPQPSTTATPIPPVFAPTRRFADYSSY